MSVKDISSQYRTLRECLMIFLKRIQNQFISLQKKTCAIIELLF